MVSHVNSNFEGIILKFLYTYIYTIMVVLMERVAVERELGSGQGVIVT